MGILRICNILLDHEIKGKPIWRYLQLKSNTFYIDSNNPMTQEEQFKKIIESAKLSAEKDDGLSSKELQEMDEILQELFEEVTLDSGFQIVKLQASKSSKLPSHNILMKIGNPNTGKSFGFREEQLGLNPFTNGKDHLYEKISVSGGIGNEHKGLQSTDLAIAFDPVLKCIKIGPLLKMLMSATLNPDSPHVLLLDDIHNQQISSLLSEFTPVFKSNEKIDYKEIKKALVSLKIDPTHIKTIKDYNDVINKIRNQIGGNIGNGKIFNRMSSESDVEVIFPSNFYLLMAGNFNRYTSHIFADWQDRSVIEYVSSLDESVIEHINSLTKGKTSLNNLNKINLELKSILSQDKYKIFDYPKYLVGVFKAAQIGLSENDLIRYSFGLIKNSLVEHGNSHLVNIIGKELVNNLLDKKIINVLANGNRCEISFYNSTNKQNIEILPSVLHSLNFYQQED